MVEATGPTTVTNIHYDDFDVYIGRTGKGYEGPWGNPYRNGTRTQNIAWHVEWLFTQPALIVRLPELKGKRLGCFCAPQRCHGDTLAWLADSEVPLHAIGEHVDSPDGRGKITGVTFDFPDRLWYTLRLEDTTIPYEVYHTLVKGVESGD